MQIAFYVLAAVFVVVAWFVLKRRARKSAETRRRRSILAAVSLILGLLASAGWFVGVVWAILTHGDSDAGLWGLRAGVEPVAVVSFAAMVLGAFAAVRCVTQRLRGIRVAVFALLVGTGTLFLTFAVLRAA